MWRNCTRSAQNFIREQEEGLEKADVAKGDVRKTRRCGTSTAGHPRLYPGKWSIRAKSSGSSTSCKVRPINTDQPLAFSRARVISATCAVLQGIPSNTVGQFARTPNRA